MSDKDKMSGLAKLTSKLVLSGVLAASSAGALSQVAGCNDFIDSPGMRQYAAHRERLPTFFLCSDWIDSDYDGVPERKELIGFNRENYIVGDQIMFVGVNNTNRRVVARILISPQAGQRHSSLLTERILNPGQGISYSVTPRPNGIMSDIITNTAYLTFDDCKVAEKTFSVEPRN